MIRQFDPVELLAGLLIIGIGTFFFIGAQNYSMGTIARMGPGYVPRGLGMLGIGLGIVILIGSVRMSGTLPRVSLRAVACILGAIAAFGMLLTQVGLVGATFVTTIIAMLGNPDASWRMITATSVVLSLLCWTLFILILGLRIPAFLWNL